MDITEQVNNIILVDCGIYVKYYFRKSITIDLPVDINEKQQMGNHHYSFLFHGIDDGLNFKYRKDFDLDEIKNNENNIIKIMINEIMKIIYEENALNEGDNDNKKLNHDLYQMYLSSTEIAIAGEKTIKTFSNGYTEKKEEECWTIGGDVQMELLHKARNEGKNNLTDDELNNIKGQKINYLLFRELTGIGKRKHSGVHGIGSDSMTIKKIKKCMELSVKHENVIHDSKNYLITFNLLIKRIFENNSGGTTVPETCHAWRVYKK